MKPHHSPSIKNTIPTTILTGFLGAGKTTYLNHLLKTNPHVRYAIIENEFGEQSIDGELIIRTDDHIIEMNNGCLCCTLNDNLYEILTQLYQRKEEFDELIIEATGIAAPAGIAEPFLINQSVKKTFRLEQVICLVDAEQIEDQISETEEAIKQISFSDILLINKSDLVDTEYLALLKTLLTNINPIAQVEIGNKNFYPSFSKRKLFQLAPKVLRHEHLETNCKHEHEHHSNCSHNSHSKTHTHQHSDISTHSFVFKPPFELEKLHHHLLIFLTFQAKDLYRFKGIFFIKDANKKYLLQSVGKRLGIEELGEWHEEEEKSSRIVFIGKKIPSQGLEKLFFKCFSAD